MEIGEIKVLIELMNDNGLAELEIEEEGSKIRLVKEGTTREVVAVSTQIPTIVSETASVAAPGGVGAGVVEEAGIVEIKAPMVGTFYRAPSPDSDPFVDEGMEVGEETVVCIIEAMKVMNEIRAEVAGTIAEILVESGQPVEYGQPLFKVRTKE